MLHILDGVEDRGSGAAMRAVKSAVHRIAIMRDVLRQDAGLARAMLLVEVVSATATTAMITSVLTTL